MKDDKSIRQHWNANAAAWANAVRAGDDKFRGLFHDPSFYGLLGDVGDQDVLDLGCGEGVVCRALAGRGACVVGVDLSDELIGLARAEEERTRLGIEYHVGSFTDLEPMEDASFDVVVSVMALMDSPELDKALGEAYRVLRPGGRFVFSVTHPFITGRETEWDDGGAALVVKKYFAGEPWVDEWAFPGGDEMQIPTFPRTVSDYMNAIISAGFRIAEVLEPQPSDDAVENDPRLARWRRVPFYLMVGAIKP